MDMMNNPLRTEEPPCRGSNWDAHGGKLPFFDENGVSKLPAGYIAVEVYADEKVVPGLEPEFGVPYPTKVVFVSEEFLREYVKRRWGTLQNFLESYTLDEVDDLCDRAKAANAQVFEAYGNFLNV